MTAARARRVRRFLIVLHVIALLGGAAAAHFTAPPDPPAPSARPRATKLQLSASALASPDRRERVPAAPIDMVLPPTSELALTATQEQPAEPVDPAVPEPASGDDPLGTRYRDGLIINGSTRHRL